MEKVENLNKLKEDYEVIRKKYDLPSFEELNQEFLIEDLQGTQSEILVQRINFIIQRWFIGKLNLLEQFANPNRSSILVLSILEKLTDEDKKFFNEIYKKFSKAEIKIWQHNSSKYNEAEEIKFIKDTIKFHEEIIPKLKKFLNRVESLYSEV